MGQDEGGGVDDALSLVYDVDVDGAVVVDACFALLPAAKLRLNVLCEAQHLVWFEICAEQGGCVQKFVVGTEVDGAGFIVFRYLYKFHPMGLAQHVDGAFYVFFALPQV